jgi:hypothetical protein
MDDRCGTTNKDGSPCNARPWKDDLCRWHHPEAQAAIREGRRKGGRAKSNRARARRQYLDGNLSLPEIQGLLSDALRQLLTGDLEPGRAQAIASLGRVLLAISQSVELEVRLQALERAARPGESA